MINLWYQGCKYECIVKEGQMEKEKRTRLTVETTIDLPIEKVWEFWTLPAHITQWYFASDDWCAPSAINDLRSGGRFSTRMEAKDGSNGFDFSGKYEEIKNHESIFYILDDERKVSIVFSQEIDGIKVSQTFEIEDVNSAELQKFGWQSILDNFKKYCESVHQ